MEWANRIEFVTIRISARTLVWAVLLFSFYGVYRLGYIVAVRQVEQMLSQLMQSQPNTDDPGGFHTPQSPSDGEPGHYHGRL